MTKSILVRYGFESEDVAACRLKGLSKKIEKDIPTLCTELQVGEPTLRDIVAELEKPGRDVRDDLPEPELRSDLLDLADLKPGMKLKGVVRNVIDFGAFVDIGVHQDGIAAPFPDFKKVHQAPVGGSVGRRSGGGHGSFGGCAEKAGSR